MIDEVRKPRAYSYLRFSTPEQKHGDSFRRQTDAAVKYAAKHGLVLDEELRLADEGVSAFRGKNAATGKLREFLEHVESGEVPKGSYLLVENLDRITRESIDEAQFQLMSILRSGVVVVTLMDERKFEWGAMDMTDLIVSLALLSRGHEESATKSKRLKSAWGAKRAELATRPLTSKCPAWLKLNAEAATFEVIPERAEVVQRMFAMAAGGAGQHKIATTLNGERIPPWGRAQHWQRSYVSKILSNPAVLGTIVPHLLEHDGGKRKRIALDPVENYYPTVVSPDLFAEVQTLRDVAGGQRRGKGARAPLSNILAGMAVCPLCGRAMTRVQKGAKSSPSLVCTRAKAGAGCKYRSVPYAWVEDALIRGLPRRLELREGQMATASYAEEAQRVDSELEELRVSLENLLDNLASESSPALRKRLRDVEAQYVAKAAELAALHDRQAAASGLSLAARADRALAALNPNEGELDREKINVALKGLFRRAVINWSEGQVELEWTHGGVCEVPYALSSQV